MQHPKPTIAFKTLGCKLNFAETSALANKFTLKGFTKVNYKDKPDITLINTCSVTNNADKKCEKLIKETIKENSQTYLIVVGCFAQLQAQKIAKIKGVDAVFGTNDKFKIFDLIDDFKKKEQPIIQVSKFDKTNSFIPSYSLSDRTRTFLKIQDGCNYNCTYCTIPLARGHSRSIIPEEIIKQAKEIATNGVKEIILTGVNIGDYGIINGKKQYNFFQLIKLLEEVEGITRFRISSIEPNLVTSEIIDFVANSKKFLPHFHIPLQSGSDLILTSMKRRYSSNLYEKKILTIINKIPHCSIGADVIVGFPGETPELFKNTYNFLKDLPLTYMHIFPYSERQSTKAVLLGNSVDMQERTERSKILRQLSERKLFLFYEKNLNSERDVLFENKKSNGKLFGYTDNYIKIQIDYNPDLCNTIHRVKLISIKNNIASVELC